MTKDEIINYIKSKYPEDKIYKSKVYISEHTVFSEHINVARGREEERCFDHIMQINSEEKVVNIWWTYFNSCDKRSIDIDHEDEFCFNNKNLKEQIDKCHESYDDARKELNNYMKELLKNKVSEL